MDDSDEGRQERRKQIPEGSPIHINIHSVNWKPALGRRRRVTEFRVVPNFSHKVMELCRDMNSAVNMELKVLSLAAKLINHDVGHVNISG